MNDVINIKNLNLIEVQIDSISSSEKNTYDIEVEDAHYYILENGIISHNTSVLCNNISSGIEPLFLTEYYRTAIVPRPDGLEIPNINWQEGTFEPIKQEWEWIKEGDEKLLKTIFNGETYKFDANRGLTKEVLVEDYSVKYRKQNNCWDKNADYAKTIYNLSVDAHIDTMTVIGKWLCSSMSKTINLPKSFSYRDFKDIYFNLWETGVIKGGTTYREGTMANVLSSTEKTVETKVTRERPKTLDCEIHHLQVKKDDWIVLVGINNKTPYEVFAFKKKQFGIPKKVKAGKLTKARKGGVYNLITEDGYELEDIRQFFEQDEEQALTRMISLALRCNGTTLIDIVEQLNKSEGTVVSFSKAVARVLKKYIANDTSVTGDTTCPSCNRTEALIYAEGCIKCKYCEYSKC